MEMGNPAWLRLDAEHWRNPDPGQFDAYLKKLKREFPIAIYDSLSVGEAPHPLFAGKTLATLCFGESDELPESMHGRQLYLANVFLDDERLRMFDGAIGELNA